MDEGVILVPTEGEDEPGQFGLSNLSQQCAADDREDWPRIIATHFTSVFDDPGRDLDALAADYDQVAAILRIRLMPDESMGGVGVLGAVVRAIAPGISAVLVYDFPDSTRRSTVEPPRGVAGGGGRGVRAGPGEPGPRAEAAARGHGRRAGDVGAHPVRRRFYVATQALRLGDVLPPGTTDAPRRRPESPHAARPPDHRGRRRRRRCKAIYRLADQLFRDGPGSISDQPYWWHDGSSRHPAHAKGRQRDVLPPDGLLAVFEDGSSPGPRRRRTAVVSFRPWSGWSSPSTGPGRRARAASAPRRRARSAIASATPACCIAR